MTSEIQYFAYTACDDFEDWIVDSNIDYWVYDGMYRFRKKYQDNIFFILYEYSTITLSTEINRLCFIPSLFHTDVPDSILMDVVATANIILQNKNHCISFFPSNQATNLRLMEKIVEVNIFCKIASIFIDGDTELSHFLVNA